MKSAHALPADFGPFRLLRRIGGGGMAEVFLGTATGVAGFEKVLAVKTIHGHLAESRPFIEMLIDEAKLAVQLQHANIVQVFDLGQVESTYYMTMEYIDGIDLAHLLQRVAVRKHRVAPKLWAYLAHEVAAALDYAHRKRDENGKSLGIIHRDVSPQNVLLGFSGAVKLVDFGVAKAQGRIAQTQAGVVKGKFGYMSPEQAKAETLDPRSDVYALGIVLYECLSMHRLFGDEDLGRKLDRVRRGDVPPLRRLVPGVAPALEATVMRALATAPADRWPTARDFGAALGAYVDSVGSVGPTDVAELVRAMTRTAATPSVDRAAAAGAGGAAAAAALDAIEERTPDPVHAREELSELSAYSLLELPPSTTGTPAVAVPSSEASLTEQPEAAASGAASMETSLTLIDGEAGAILAAAVAKLRPGPPLPPPLHMLKTDPKRKVHVRPVEGDGPTLLDDTDGDGLDEAPAMLEASTLVEMDVPAALQAVQESGNVAQYLRTADTHRRAVVTGAATAGGRTFSTEITARPTGPIAQTGDATQRMPAVGAAAASTEADAAWISIRNRLLLSLSVGLVVLALCSVAINRCTSRGASTPPSVSSSLVDAGAPP
jgi:hypothetical protein